MSRVRMTTVLLGVVFATTQLRAPSVAGAQTTRPASEQDSWPQVVEQLAAALIEGHRDDFRAMLAPDASVRSFQDSAAGDVDRLLARASLSAMVGAHAYVHPPLVMAADLMADCKNSELLPDSIRERMVPQDDVAMQRANATAAQWISQTLDATAGDRVAIFVFFEPNDALPPATSHNIASSSLTGDLLFVLVHARRTSDTPASPNSAGAALVDRVVYGNPLSGAALAPQ